MDCSRYVDNVVMFVHLSSIKNINLFMPQMEIKYPNFYRHFVHAVLVKELNRFMQLNAWSQKALSSTYD